MHPCSKCSQLTSNHLILECPHSLCFQCASKLLNKLQARGRGSARPFTHIECQICSTPTYLKPESLEELLAQRQHNNNQVSHDRQSLTSTLSKNNHNNNYSNSRLASRPQSPPLYSLGSRIHSSPIDLYQPSQQHHINTHNTNPLAGVMNVGAGASAADPMLYCFSCESTCFSIDEYLGGMHHSHNVKNIQKNDCLNIMKGMLQNIGEKVRFKLQASLKQSNKLSVKKRELIQTFGSIKTTIEVELQKLINIIRQKKAELLDSLEQTMSKRFGVIDSAIDEMRQYTIKCEGFHELIERNRTVLQGESTTVETFRVFNFYSQRKRQILDELSKEVEEVSEGVNAQLSNLLISTQHIYQTMEQAKSIRILFKEEDPFSQFNPLLPSSARRNKEANFFETIKRQIFSSKEPENTATATRINPLLNVTSVMNGSASIHALTRIKSSDNLRQAMFSPSRNQNLLHNQSKNMQSRVQQKMKNLEQLISGKAATGTAKRRPFF